GPFAPGDLAACRGGVRLSRLVADVDALRNLRLRGVGPPFVALVAGGVSVAATAAFLPSAALVLACGLLVAGIALPVATAVLGNRAGRVQAEARGHLTAELVEVLAAAPELAVYGHVDERLERLRESDTALVGAARRSALAD